MLLGKKGAGLLNLLLRGGWAKLGGWLQYIRVQEGSRHQNVVLACQSHLRAIVVRAVMFTEADILAPSQSFVSVSMIKPMIHTWW